jgi:uncharacterized protein YjbI with pentapeptide repeats
MSGHDAALQAALLRGADFSRASLSCAVLPDADLESVNFSEANLAAADLGHAFLRDANLRGAWLCRTTLTHANMERAQLEGSHYNAATTFPADYAVAESGALVDVKCDDAGFIGGCEHAKALGANK